MSFGKFYLSIHSQKRGNILRQTSSKNRLKITHFLANAWPFCYAMQI